MQLGSRPYRQPAVVMSNIFTTSSGTLAGADISFHCQPDLTDHRRWWWRWREKEFCFPLYPSAFLVLSLQNCELSTLVGKCGVEGRTKKNELHSHCLNIPLLLPLSQLQGWWQQGDQARQCWSRCRVWTTWVWKDTDIYNVIFFHMTKSFLLIGGLNVTLNVEREKTVD